MSDLRPSRPWGHRLGIGLAGLGLVVAVGVPASGLFSPADGPARLDTVAAPSRPFTVPLPEVPDREAFAIEAVPMVEPIEPPPIPERVEHSFEERVETGAIAIGDPPGQCSVHAAPDRSDPNTGDRSSGHGCSFIAGADGGYRARGTWRVEITRGDEVIVHSSEAGAPACVPVGTIRAGDEVSVEALTEYGPLAEPSSVDAGDRIGC